MVDKRLRHLVSEFTPVNGRMATIRIRAKFYNVSLTCAHSPTEEKDDKDAFYANLEDVYDKWPAHDAKIVFEHFTSKGMRWIGFAALNYAAPSFSISTFTRPLGCPLID